MSEISKPHSELVPSLDEFIEFSEEWAAACPDFGPMFYRDAARVARYARDLEEQLEAAQTLAARLTEEAEWGADILADAQRTKEQLEVADQKIQAHHSAALLEGESLYRCLICEHVEALHSNPASEPRSPFPKPKMVEIGSEFADSNQESRPKEDA